MLDTVVGLDVSRLFDARSVDELAREKARLEAISGREQGDKNLYYLLTFPLGTDVASLPNQLNALDLVEIAYPIGDDPPPPSHEGYQPSPIVAAAAGIVSSVAQANGDANGLNSTEARALLVATGTPQNFSGSALAGNIGPLPNLAAALGLTADVAITKTADADPVVAGEDLGYELTVTNSGPNVATDVTVTDALPTEAVLDSASPACTPSGTDLICDLGNPRRRLGVETFDLGEPSRFLYCQQAIDAAQRARSIRTSPPAHVDTRTVPARRSVRPLTASATVGARDIEWVERPECSSAVRILCACGTETARD